MYQRLPAPLLKPSNHLFSSPCSKPQPENDVFLNFRGEDTRNNFTDHLYRALEGKRIKTFKDDTKLEPGNPISLKLLDAIEKSRIAVVILSKNYASSTWCLEELVKILECKEEKGGLTVLPIFYHVEPKIVRHQKKTFAVAFAEHENRFQKKKVQIWRKALSDVAELSGKTLTNGPEGKFIQEIVDWIFNILKDKRSIVYEDGFVGIDSRVEEMNSFLDMNSNDVRFIGICGKSGMGKTTLARFVFDKIRNQFEACSFLENVKEVSKGGLETLQEQLLCDISKEALRVRDVGRGIQVIRNILRDKKVLIVVDDASEKRHLQALVGKIWFGPRSRIIVTTEDECLLKSYEIQTIYKADGLNNDEAQRLFSHKAHCEIDFLDLGNDFVTYAQGNPLVLKVLGSHLCKRTKEEWETAWNQLKDILNEDIPEKLRIAYNGLEELEKKLFLHIACFFKGEDQNRVAAILESVCYWDDNIRKLIDKSLITIVGGKLCMHHLIQQMGWKIVCGESKDLGRRSRLWDCSDVLYVLKNNIGTDRIEGMVLNLPPNEEQEELNAEPFSKMNKLKLLKICKLNLPCLSNLSNELLLLEWHEYPLKSLPKSFQPPELVELIMHHSGIEQLPSEFSNLHKLKLIDLSDSQNLCQTPNFNGLPNIERLIFQGCTGLHALHPSVGSLERLILLNLKDCKCLENLLHEINLKSLKILILSGCSKLKKFPKIGRNMTSMLELYLDRTAIEELPSSIKHLTSLTLLNLQDCENLSSFPSVICCLISLEILILSGCKGQREPEPISLVLPLSFSGLSSLVSLDLSGCNLLDGALPDDLSYLSSLTSLNLRNNNFTCLPCSISQLLNLKLLFLDHCSKLQSLPYLPLSTQFVSAQGCTSLENYSNQVIVWTSGAARFTFINCHGLADDEGKIADVPSLKIHFQSLWQRYMEDQILQIKGFCLVLPQIEIPEWFKNKECGPSVRIPLPPNLFNNRSWKGIALCVIFVVPPNLIDVSPGQDSKYFHEFFCHFDMDGSLLNCPLVLKVPKETFVGSFGLWLYISHVRFTEHFDEGSCISSLIRPKRLDIQIKMCGAQILYEQDMLEFVQNSRQENFRSCDDLSRGHEKFIEDHMSSSQSYDLKLKQKLNSLLSTLYQVDWAKNHLYDYIFHQIARPPCWFTRTNLGPSIEMPLPADVHDNSTWLGFTICASYRIQMRAGFSYKLHSTICLRYSSLSTSDEVSFASYTTFPLSKDVLDESPQDSGRLVVFYIPRRGFQLKQCDHIGASFESRDPAVQFEMCGIRLVYEQNVPEYVQTLVECVLGSPDANHQSFSVRLSDQLGMMQYCNHEKENCCHFLLERRLDPDTMRMLLPNNETIQEECTSRETFSNQVIAAGISKNSSRGSINLGIPFGNGQYGSKMSGILECWFKPYLQNHNRSRSTFNRCSPQSEIPKWFTKKINDSSLRIPLHSNFYNNPDWIGFAISSVFSSHMNPTTTRSRFSLMAICHLKTNLGCMNPLLYCGIREEHVLTLLHQRIFLWESIISHLLLSPKFSECTWIEFSFVSDSPDMSARKCAVDLVYRDNLEDFTLTMAPCITSCDDPFTSNERLPFYHRDKFSGSDGLYEDQANGTSGQYSYGVQHPRYQLFQTAALDFNPSTSYNCCFPPSKIQDWFSHQNHGFSATMDLPSNLYHNSNWMGLVLYSSFSIQGDSNFILSNLNSGKSHTLYCQCQMSMANVDDQTIAISTSKEEITWLLELGEFIWISYVPGEPFKNMLQHCSRIETSFLSDWPSVIVQNCALQLLYQHDQVQFEQELKHCNNLIFENRELIRKQQEDQKKRNEQYHVDERLQIIDFEVKLFPRLIDQPETDEAETELGQSDLLENLDKVDKWRVASKEVTKISRERLEKGELLQSEFLNEPRDDLEEREAAIELRERIEEQELLSEFLLLIQQRKQEAADKLQDTISFLCADIEEVMKQQALLKKKGGSCPEMGKDDLLMSSLPPMNIVDSGDSTSLGSRKRFRSGMQIQNIEEYDDNLDDGQKSDTLNENIGNLLSKSSRLMKNFKKLEAAYFLTRCRPVEPSGKPLIRHSTISSDGKGSIGLTERSSVNNLAPKEQYSEGRQTGWINPFLEGLCKYLSFSKLKVKADLKQGDLLNSSNLVCSLSFDCDGEFFATAGVNKKIEVFECDTIINEDRDIHYPVVEMASRSKLSSICWNSYIKSQIASSNYEGVVQVWDVTRSQALMEMREHERRVWSIDYSSADPTMLASGSDDSSVKLWSINQGVSIGTIKTKANVCCVQFPLDSSHSLAFGSADHKIYYYDLRNLKTPLCTFIGHNKTVSYIKFVDATSIVSASTDNTLKLWDLSMCTSRVNDTPVQSFTGHMNVKNFVGLSVSDGYIATGSETNEVFIYHKAFPMPALSFKYHNTDPLSSHEMDDAAQFISSVCWRGQSSTLVAANSTGNIKILEMV